MLVSESMSTSSIPVKSSKQDFSLEEFEAERIIDAKLGRFQNGIYAYKVRWKGYGPDDDSWVDSPDTTNCQELVAEYWDHVDYLSHASRPTSVIESDSEQYLEEERVENNKRANSTVAQAVQEDTRETSVRNASTKSDARKSPLGHPYVRQPSRHQTKIKLGVSSNRSRSARLSTGRSTVRAPANLPNHANAPGTEHWEHLVRGIDRALRDSNGSSSFLWTSVEGHQTVSSVELIRKMCPQKTIDYLLSRVEWTFDDRINDQVPYGNTHE